MKPIEDRITKYLDDQVQYFKELKKDCAGEKSKLMVDTYIESFELMRTRVELEKNNDKLYNKHTK